MTSGTGVTGKRHPHRSAAIVYAVVGGLFLLLGVVTFALNDPAEYESRTLVVDGCSMGGRTCACDGSIVDDDGTVLDEWDRVHNIDSGACRALPPDGITVYTRDGGDRYTGAPRKMRVGGVCAVLFGLGAFGVALVHRPRPVPVPDDGDGDGADGANSPFRSSRVRR